MALHVDAFDQSVKYLSTKGVPLGIKRINRKEALLILTDSVILINATEMANTLSDVMRWKDD